MGKDLFDKYPAAREVFEKVDLVLGEKLSEIIFDGDEEELTLTHNAQPALLAVSMATIAAIGRTPNCKYMAGHSLGEYSALCAAGALSLEDAARLVRFRGQAMQRAVPKGKGAMAAIIGMKISQIEEITKKSGCFIANDNSASQVVISGEVSAVENAMQMAKDDGAKRAIKLPVSAPFHCPLMEGAAKEMASMLEKIQISAPSAPIINNVTALPEEDPNVLKQLLIKQITGQVKWRQTILFLAQNGTDSAIEIGAGKVLSGLCKRAEEKIPCISVGSVQSVSDFCQTSGT